MQKIADHYLKNNKAPGPDSFQAELIKTMPPEQRTVIKQWLDEILTTGEIVTKVTEKDMQRETDGAGTEIPTSRHRL